MNRKIIYVIIAVIIILVFSMISVSVLTADDTKYDVKVSYDGDWVGEYNISSAGTTYLNENFSGNGTETFQVFRNGTDDISVFVHSNDTNSTKELKVGLAQNGRIITESFTYNSSIGVKLVA